MCEPPRVTCPRCGDLGPATLTRTTDGRWAFDVTAGIDHDCPATDQEDE